jgi:hypothetical protein
MSSSPSGGFIYECDFASAGESRANNIVRYGRVDFNADDSNELTVPLGVTCPTCDQPDDTLAFLEMIVPTDRDTLSETECGRWLCHSLLQQLPESEMREAVETLTQMYEFHQDSRVPAAPPASAGSIKARITRSYTAPVFPVPDE